MAGDNGGPAFPAPEAGQQHFGDPAAYTGMTLRDYFAAKAMQGDWACGNAGINGCPLEDDAKRYYAMADAMLKERAK